MADPSPHPPSDVDRSDDARGGRRRYTDTPRWVKLFVIMTITLVLLLAIPLLAGGGHGPGRHSP